MLLSEMFIVSPLSLGLQTDDKNNVIKEEMCIVNFIRICSTSIILELSSYVAGEVRLDYEY